MWPMSKLPAPTSWPITIRLRLSVELTHEVACAAVKHAAVPQGACEIQGEVMRLDRLPEASGLDVVRLLRKNQMPLVAFVTAFDEYAVQAFEVNAVDYLLKPIEKAAPPRSGSRRDRKKKPPSRAAVWSPDSKGMIADSLVLLSVGVGETVVG